MGNLGHVQNSARPRLDVKRTENFLKFQRNTISKLNGVLTRHCILGVHSKRVGPGHLTNDFCKKCKDEEEEKTTPTVELMPGFLYLGAFYFADFSDLSCFDIGNLNRFI